VEKILIFTVHGVRHAFPLANVERIVTAVEITPISGTPAVLLGTINVAGLVVPILNLRKLLGYPDKEIEISDHFIIAKSKEAVIALVADFVENVQEVSSQIGAGEVLPHWDWVSGFAITDQGTVTIHSLERIVSSIDAQVRSAYPEGRFTP